MSLLKISASHLILPCRFNNGVWKWVTISFFRDIYLKITDFWSYLLRIQWVNMKSRGVSLVHVSQWGVGDFTVIGPYSCMSSAQLKSSCRGVTLLGSLNIGLTFRCQCNTYIGPDVSHHCACRWPGTWGCQAICKHCGDCPKLVFSWEFLRSLLISDNVELIRQHNSKLPVKISMESPCLSESIKEKLLCCSSYWILFIPCTFYRLW